MMSCAEFRLQSSAFLDGELAPGEQARAEEHLAACAPCAASLASLRATVALAADETLLAPPEGASQRLHAAIERALAAGAFAPPPLPARPARRLSWQPWLAAAALVLIAFGGLQWWQQSRVRTWQGWLIDAHCAVKYEAAHKLPAQHPRWCTLQAPCESSGYGIFTLAGAFERFDSAGSSEADQMLRARGDNQSLRITVRGRQQGGVIHPLRLAFDTSGQTLAVHSDSAAPEAGAVLVSSR